MEPLSQKDIAQLIETHFQPDSTLSLTPTFTGSVGTAPLNAANDTVVDVDGNTAHLSNHATQADIDHTTSRLKAENADEQRIAVNAGVQTNHQFMGTQQHEKKKLEAKKKAEQARKSNDALLTMLQGQLADLYEERNEGLAHYLSQSEIETINRLPREQQDQAIRDKMQEKLESGDITQAQYDQFTAWYEDWSKREWDKQQQIQDLNNAQTPEQVKAIVDSVGSGTSASVSRNLDAAKQVTVEKSVEARDDAGHVSVTENLADVFSDLGTGSDLFASAPDIKEDFTMASSSTVEPQPSVELNQKQPAIVSPTTPTIG